MRNKRKDLVAPAHSGIAQNFKGCGIEKQAPKGIYSKEERLPVLTEDQRSEIQREIESHFSVLLQSTQSSARAQSLEPLVRVIARVVEVLGTSEKALRWLNAPIRSLGDRTPTSLLGTPEGIKRVEDALGRIEHGVW
jgi:putative toxin-antitoxin system antitoxin component (TIGR02293 family)